MRKRPETNRIHLVLFGMQNRTFGPYSTAIHRTLTFTQIGASDGFRSVVDDGWGALQGFVQRVTDVAYEAAPDGVSRGVVRVLKIGRRLPIVWPPMGCRLPIVWPPMGCRFLACGPWRYACRTSICPAFDSMLVVVPARQDASHKCFWHVMRPPLWVWGAPAPAEALWLRELPAVPRSG
jgi:hypothetical protein